MKNFFFYIVVFEVKTPITFILRLKLMFISPNLYSNREKCYKKYSFFIRVTYINQI